MRAGLVGLVLAVIPMQASASTWCGDFLAGSEESRGEMADALIRVVASNTGVNLECMRVLNVKSKARNACATPEYVEQRDSGVAEVVSRFPITPFLCASLARC